MAKLPVFEMVIDENPESEIEVSFVALVDRPAIEKNFLVFNDNFVNPKQGETKDDFLKRCIPVLINENKDQEQAVAVCSSIWENKGQSLGFSIVNEEKRIISGVAMLADTLIYRKDESGEYNVFFSKDTIEQIALKFFKKDYHKNLNLFHNSNLAIDGVTIFESFVTDKNRGILPMEQFKDVPDGSWFISAKIENDEIWSKIKSGEVKGFSVEGIFAYMKKPKQIENHIVEIVSATYPQSIHFKERLNTMVKEMIAKFKQMFTGDIVQPVVPEKLSVTMTTTDGKTLVMESMTVGMVCNMLDAAGNEVPCPAGTYTFTDGSSIVCDESGKITEVVPATAAPVESVQMTEQMVKDLIQQSLKDYHQAIETQKLETERMAGLQKLQDEKIKGLFEIIEELSKIPAADPIESRQNNFATGKPAVKAESLKRLSDHLSKLKSSV